MSRLLLVISLSMVVLAACSRHDDPPPALPIVEPPQPTNFTVTTQDSVVYELSWDVDDPTVVSFYLLYSQVDIPFAGLQVDTIPGTSAQVNLGLPLPVTFCVSSVTFENVESLLTCATAP
ncbi:MAG: hypothetical protein JSW50_13430 [Candidatus Latescibacterota bacterium]|nr:MAG: hypothetical protein JSW50_13430 [Candidatus Latescibacterota bacterium]